MWSWIAAILGAVIAGFILRNKSLIDGRVNAIIAHINAMESLGHEYWSHDSSYPKNKQLEVEIKRLSHRIGVDLKQLNNDCFGYNFSRDKLRLLTLFRQSITGGSFERANRQVDEDVVKKISIPCNMLIDHCRKSIKSFIIF